MSGKKIIEGLQDAIRFARGEPVGRVTRYFIKRKGERCVITAEGESIPRIYHQNQAAAKE
jgi:hypothetical protein